jgi:hypothetical protein
LLSGAFVALVGEAVAPPALMRSIRRAVGLGIKKATNTPATLPTSGPTMTPTTVDGISGLV